MYWFIYNTSAYRATKKTTTAAMQNAVSSICYASIKYYRGTYYVILNFRISTYFEFQRVDASATS